MKLSGDRRRRPIWIVAASLPAILALLATGCSANSDQVDAAQRGAQEDVATNSSSSGDAGVVFRFTNRTGDPLSFTYVSEADGNETKVGGQNDSLDEPMAILVVNPSEDFKQGWVLNKGSKEYKFNPVPDQAPGFRNSCTNEDKLKSLPKVENGVVSVDFLSGSMFDGEFSSPIGYWGKVTYPNGDWCKFKMDRKFWRPDGAWLRVLASIGIVAGAFTAVGVTVMAFPAVLAKAADWAAVKLAGSAGTLTYWATKESANYERLQAALRDIEAGRPPSEEWKAADLLSKTARVAKPKSWKGFTP